MTLSEAIAETMRRAEKDQEFLRRTLEKRRKETETAQARDPKTDLPQTAPEGRQRR